MIIRTHVDISSLISASKKVEEKGKKPVVNEVSKKKNNKKNTPAPVVEEIPVVAEEKVEEDIDLSEWLKEDIDE